MPILSLYTNSQDGMINSNNVQDWTGNDVKTGKNSGTYRFDSWIPFTNVKVPNKQQILTATLKVVCSVSGSNTTCKQRFYCEGVDNATTQPTSWTDISGRTLTTAYLENLNMPAWTAGVEYSFNMTSPVQEIFNRTGWVYGNALAIMIIDQGSTASAERWFASEENATYPQALLELILPGGVNPISISPYLMV